MTSTLKIYLVLATITTTLTKEIKITQITNSPGILPFKIGAAKISTNKHIFLHEINLSELEKTIQNLKNSYDELKPTLTSTNYILLKSLTNQYDNLKPLLNEVFQKYYNINPKIRNKRGLINLGGNIHKFLFGTLDSSDGERYDQAISTLKENQKKIVTEMNNQITLSKELMKRYTNDINTIVTNQNKIFDYVSNFQGHIKNITDQFNKHSTYLSIFNQIFTNIHMLITFLDNLENAITFAKLHVVHPDILTSQNLGSLLTDLRKTYGNEKILNLNIHSWYSIMHTNCYFLRNKIIFAIEFPIFTSRTFQYFQLYPIPTNENTIIIPPKPYLALQEDFFQFMDLPCAEIEDIYICPQKELQSTKNQNCIPSLIQDKKSFCIQNLIKPISLVFNKINNEYLLLISQKEIRIQLKCSNEKFATFQGQALLKIPENCSIHYQTLKFGNTKSTSIGKPLILPKINTNVSTMVKLDKKPLQIDHIPLEEIHRLGEQIKATDQLSIQEVKFHQSSWFTWTIISVFIVAILLKIGISKFWKRKSNEIKIVQETQSPSYLYQSEADS